MDLSRSRPGVRRKSSASNLLLQSLGKSGSSSGPPPTVITTSGNAFHASSISSATSSTVVGSSTGAFASPTSKEWDSQSMFSDSSNSNTAILSATVSPTTTVSSGLPQSSALMSANADMLKDTVAKRMKTFSFLKTVHEGKAHYLQSIQFTRADLDSVFDNGKMRKRTYRFHILGMSLSTLWEIAAPYDFLRGLSTLLDQWEQLQDDNYKPKMKNLFKGSKAPRRPSGQDASLSFSDLMADGSSLLLTPSIPFHLDYSQTLYSLYDILLETYHKIYRLLGPSILPSSHASTSQSHLNNARSGPHPRTKSATYKDRDRDDDGVGISLITPLPIVPVIGELSDLQFSPGGLGLAFGVGDDSPVDSVSSAATQQRQTTRQSQPNAHAPRRDGMGLPYGVGLPPMPEPPPPWNPALGEMIIKIDNKVKKIWVPIVKEMDTLARELIKQELAFLSAGGDGLNGWVDFDGPS